MSTLGSLEHGLSGLGIPFVLKPSQVKGGVRIYVPPGRIEHVHRWVYNVWEHRPAAVLFEVLAGIDRGTFVEEPSPYPAISDADRALAQEVEAARARRGEPAFVPVKPASPNWRPTCELRLLEIIPGATCRFQQKWITDDAGQEEWRAIPVVTQ